MPIQTRSRTSRPKLPLDIQLCVLEWMVALSKTDRRVRVSSCAAVSRTWQSIIERQLFRHLTLALKDLKSFAKYCDGRKHHVKHILLELFICPEPPGNEVNEVCYRRATKALFRTISAWDVRGITLELGVVKGKKTHWTGCLETFHTHSNRVPPRKRPSYLEALQDIDEVDRIVMSNPSLMEWGFRRMVLNHFNYKPLALAMGRPNDAPLLDEVACVSKLLIRRQYMPNISPRSLATIMLSLSSLESLQIERWWYGQSKYDREWDANMDKLVIAWPKSFKEFSFYEERGTPFLVRPGGMTTQSNPTFLRAFINAAKNVEHIAITLNASSFFTSSTEFKALRTIALTSADLLSPFAGIKDQLLVVAATAAKGMPKLETLELWCYTFEKVAIFTYENPGQNHSCITWKENDTVQMMSGNAQTAWKELFDEQNRIWEVRHEQLPWNKGDGLGALYPHLALRDRILHDITWTQV